MPSHFTDKNHTHAYLHLTLLCGCILQASTSHSSLVAAAASLSTELLSPMAFITSTSRKTPPVTYTQGMLSITVLT